MYEQIDPKHTSHYNLNYKVNCSMVQTIMPYVHCKATIKAHEKPLAYKKDTILVPKWD